MKLEAALLVQRTKNAALMFASCEKSFVCEWGGIPHILTAALMSREVFGLCHLQRKATNFLVVHFHSVYTACNPNSFSANICLYQKTGRSVTPLINISAEKDWTTDIVSLVFSYQCSAVSDVTDTKICGVFAQFIGQYYRKGIFLCTFLCICTRNIPCIMN